MPQSPRRSRAPPLSERYFFGWPTSIYGMMLSMRWKWKKLFSYGEVICFVTAWAVGLLLARDQERLIDHRAAVRTFATATELPGVQAAMGR